MSAVRLKLSISATKLSSFGGLHKPNAFAIVVALGEDPSNIDEPNILGTTEVIHSAANPSWAKQFTIESYRFGRPHYLEVRIFEANSRIASSRLKRSNTATRNSDDVGIGHSAVFPESIRTPRCMRHDGGFSPTSPASPLALTEQGEYLSRLVPKKCIGSAQFEVGNILSRRGNVLSKCLKEGGVLCASIQKCEEGSMGSLWFRVRGIGLQNSHLDLLSKKSNPYFEVCQREEKLTGAVWNCVIRSRVVKSSLNPSWDEAEIDVERFCNGDLDKSIKFLVWDHRRSGKNRRMGEFETSIKTFLESTSRRNLTGIESFFTLMKDGKEVGRVEVVEAHIIHYEEMETKKREEAFWQVSQERIADDSDGNCDNERAVEYATVSLDGRGGTPYDNRLFNNERAKTVFDNNNRYHERAEQVRLPPIVEGSILSAPATAYDNISQLSRSSRFSKKPQFVDYLQGCCDINLAVAIDFTSHNGDPKQPSSLHYVHKSVDGTRIKGQNDYEQAIISVGSILAKFDSDQMIPVWGFGARYDNVVRHCFRCGQNDEVHGVKGILEAYREVFQSPLIMSRQSVFTDVILVAAAYAMEKQSKAHQCGRLAYTLLLILTAGHVSNVPKTKLELRNVSEAPLSVVIVGVGDGSFETMQFLDEDDVEGGNIRDITQFVKFNEHRSSMLSLSESVLQEIPDQLVDYFFERGIRPGEPEIFDHSSVSAEPLEETCGGFDDFLNSLDTKEGAGVKAR